VLYLIQDLMESNVQKMIDKKSVDLNIFTKVKKIFYQALKGLKALHDN
jgi:hypothetical protein